VQGSGIVLLDKSKGSVLRVTSVDGPVGGGVSVRYEFCSTARAILGIRVLPGSLFTGLR
jgi:hypothetical protein